jgi:hypothetical protein
LAGPLDIGSVQCDRARNPAAICLRLLASRRRFVSVLGDENQRRQARERGDIPWQRMKVYFCGFEWGTDSGFCVGNRTGVRGCQQDRRRLQAEQQRAKRLRARMAAPFQEISPCEAASYPRVRRAFRERASCSVLSPWRLTTSGSALDNQGRGQPRRSPPGHFYGRLSWISRGTSADTLRASSDNRPDRSSSGTEQRYTPHNVYCVFIEMCLEPCLKIRLPV